MNVNDDEIFSVDTALNHQRQLERLAYGRNSSSVEKEDASAELAALRRPVELDLLATNDSTPGGHSRTTNFIVYLVCSLSVSALALAVGQLTRVAYTVGIRDAPYLASMPLSLIPPFETAAPVTVVGGLAGLGLLLAYWLKSRQWFRMLGFLALAVSTTAILIGSFLLPVDAARTSISPTLTATDPPMGSYFNQLFNTSQAAEDLPSAPLPDAIDPGSVRRLTGLTETGNAAVYGARNTTGQVCLIVFDERGAQASACQNSVDFAAQGIHLQMTGWFRLDTDDNQLRQALQSHLNVTWNPDRGVGIQFSQG